MILEVGAIALPFALLGTDGREYHLPKDLSHQPAVLVFFKTTCNTCDLAFPYVNRLRAAYPDGWQLWAISQDPTDRSREYASRHGITYPVLVDAPGYAASKLYDPPATPTLVLIDSNGRVAYTTHGFSKDDLNALSRLLAAHLRVESEILAPPDDGQPAFRPG